MNLIFYQSFRKDLEKIKDRQVLDQIKALLDKLERAKNLKCIHGIKKIASTRNAYRIRVRDYRIGLLLRNQTIELVRVLHRKDIYKYFL